MMPLTEPAMTYCRLDMEEEIPALQNLLWALENSQSDGPEPSTKIVYESLCVKDMDQWHNKTQWNMYTLLGSWDSMYEMMYWKLVILPMMGPILMTFLHIQYIDSNYHCTTTR